MSRQLILICFLLMFSRISIAQSEQPGPKPTKDPTVYKGVTDKSCAVEMAFGSYGSGIDGSALDKLHNLIDSRKIKYTTKSIGREGEVRFCMPLTELKGKKRTLFIKELKKIAKEGQLVSVSIR
jgi:hypothetical protein